jgi:hypothetical protein
MGRRLHFMYNFSVLFISIIKATTKTDRKKRKNRVNKGLLYDKKEKRKLLRTQVSVTAFNKFKSFFLKREGSTY